MNIGDRVIMHHRQQEVVRDALNRNITLRADGSLDGTIINKYSLPGAPEVYDIACIDQAGLTTIELGVHILKDYDKRPRGLRYAEHPDRVQGPLELEP
jgi:hypothetical protein